MLNDDVQIIFQFIIWHSFTLIYGAETDTCITINETELQTLQLQKSEVPAKNGFKPIQCLKFILYS